jgi:thiol-disulfide isomerase/thioredoxin
MVERALVLVIASGAVAAMVILTRWRLGRATAGLRARSSQGLWTALGTAPDGRPSLVVFSTPSCTVCRTEQYPAVATVEAIFGSALRILRVDLSRQPAAATAFKVLTAPSTALLTGDGQVGDFNHGFAPADQLTAQLSALGASPASPR